MKHRYLGALVAGVALAATVATPAFAWTAARGGVAKVCFAPSGLSTVAAQQSALAAQEWNNVTTGLNVTWGNCAPDTNIVRVAFGTLPANVMGETKVIGQHQTVDSASITYDPVQVAKATAEDGNAPAVGWRSTVCHEMGHALGLDHNPALDSCMIANGPLDKLHPGALDKSLLKQWYPGAAKAVVTPAASSPTSLRFTPIFAPGSVVTPAAPANITGQSHSVIRDDFQSRAQLMSWRYHLQMQARAHSRHVTSLF